MARTSLEPCTYVLDGKFELMSVNRSTRARGIKGYISDFLHHEGMLYVFIEIASLR